MTCWDMFSLGSSLLWCHTLMFLTKEEIEGLRTPLSCVLATCKLKNRCLNDLKHDLKWQITVILGQGIKVKPVKQH